MCEWYDDPVYDFFEEAIEGRSFKGDDWRRMMALRERTAARLHVVPLAGTTFHAQGIKAALDGSARSVRLVAEPHNAFDANAVGVHIGAHRVGYWPRGNKAPRSERMRTRVQARCPPGATRLARNDGVLRPPQKERGR